MNFTIIHNPSLPPLILRGGIISDMKKYWMVSKNTWDEALVYRLNLILWRVRVVIRFLITYFLWSSIYTGDQQFFGYTRETMLTYVLMVYLVSNFVFATRTQDIGDDINEGKLTNYLLRPANYFAILAWRDVSDKLLNFGFTVVEFLLLFFLLHPPIFHQQNFLLIGLTAFAFVGAVMVYFSISVLLGFLGFWTSEIWASRFIFIIFLDFLAGNFFPIDILPPTIAKILLLTPFPYMFYFPVKIYLGQLDFAQMLQGFLVLAVWLIFLMKLMSVIWQKGLQVYSAEGR